MPGDEHKLHGIISRLRRRAYALPLVKSLLRKLLNPRLLEDVSLIVRAGEKVIVIREPFMRDMRWKGVNGFSTTFKALSAHERLYRLCRAYLEAAMTLCERAGEAGPRLEWPQASVVCYCLYHATELFLKACILTTGCEPPKVHDVPQLLQRYLELFPAPEFSFEVPTRWNRSAQEINEMWGVEVIPPGVDRTPDQLYRYGMDKRGAPPTGVQQFVPGLEFNYMKYLEERWTAIWAAIR